MLFGDIELSDMFQFIVFQPPPPPADGIKRALKIGKERQMVNLGAFCSI